MSKKLEHIRERLMAVDYSLLDGESREKYKEQARFLLRGIVTSDLVFQKIAEHEISPVGKTKDELIKHYLELMRELLIGD